MGGKSIFIRQVALLQIIAQVGAKEDNCNIFVLNKILIEI